MDEMIGLTAGGNYLDNSMGFWVIKAPGDIPVRPLRTKVDNPDAIRAVAEGWLHVSLHHLDDVTWRGLNNSECVLVRADQLAQYWFVVMELQELHTWYAYLIAPDGTPSALGTVSPVSGDEATRAGRIEELLIEARTRAEG